MFRSGGPIKEGIMDGMKEPQAINTVGSPLAPKDASGRQGYAVPMALMAAARFLPAAVRGFRAARAFTPGRLGTFGRIKDIFTPSRGLSAAVGKTGPMPVAAGEGAGFRIGSLIRSNPITALSTPSLATSAVTGVGPAAVDLAKATANFLVPGERFDPFKDKDPKTTEKDDTGLEVVDNFGEQKKGGEAVSQEKKDQITADRIEENRKRYYKLMGIDKMKKGAAYDSLIDASRIIQEQGGDLKGAIKSGTLQSAIINAISKNLDKSTDLKKQIDAAILKGEITKDIASDDTTKKRLDEARIKALDRAEQENTTTAKISKIFQANKGAITAGETASVLREDGISYDDLIPDKEFLKFQKNNPGADEVDFFKSIGGKLEDGRYVVGSRLIEKRGDQIKLVV